MPIPFACPHCGLETLVDDEYAGDSGPCAACGKTIVVPYRSPDGNGGTATITVKSRRAKTPIGLMFVIGLGAIAAAAMVIGLASVIVFPAVSAARAVSQRRACESNLQKIGMALQAYEAEHGTLPPAYIPDENGKPKHSWRVLILPYLDEQGVYNQYNFDEPWDGPTNSQLMLRMPDVYGCPSDPDGRSLGETNYMVVMGSETFFPENGVKKSSDAGDPPATTILVVETPVAGVTWLEPRDLKFDRMQFIINDGFGVEMGSFHKEGAHVLMADGSVRYLTDTTASDYVQGMLTINGGEPIPAETVNN